MITEEKKAYSPNAIQEDIKPWFDNLIENIRIDQLKLETNTASEEQKELYNAMISGNESEIFSKMRSTSSMHFINKIVHYYLKELVARKVNPLQLAFDISNSEVLVWAEINDDDEETERNLIMAEAKANSEFYKHGFHISTTILEKIDEHEIPSHYQKFNL